MYRLIGSVLLILVIVGAYYASNSKDEPEESNPVVAPKEPAAPGKNFNL